MDLPYWKQVRNLMIFISNRKYIGPNDLGMAAKEYD